MNEQDLHERTGATGTLEFMPPELLFKDEFGEFKGEHSPKAVCFLTKIRICGHWALFCISCVILGYLGLK